MFMVLLIGGPRFLRGMPRTYFVSAWAFLGALVASIVLFIPRRLLLAHRVRDHRVRADLRLDRRVHPLPGRRRPEGLTGRALSSGRRARRGSTRRWARSSSDASTGSATDSRASSGPDSSAADSARQTRSATDSSDGSALGLATLRRAPRLVIETDSGTKASTVSGSSGCFDRLGDRLLGLGDRFRSASSGGDGRSGLAGRDLDVGSLLEHRHRRPRRRRPPRRLRARDARGATHLRSTAGRRRRRGRLPARASSRRHPSSHHDERHGAPWLPRRGCRASAARAASGRSTRSGRRSRRSRAAAR